MLTVRLPQVGLFVLAMGLAGCTGDGGPANRLPTKKVAVTVNYKGAPLEGATVTFVPQTAGAPPAVGKTDAQGKAQLKTYVEGDGAVVGQHKVLIDKSEAVGGQSVDQNSPQYDPNAPPATIKYHIPKKYADYANSGLSAEVKDSGPNEFSFDLKD